MMGNLNRAGVIVTMCLSSIIAIIGAALLYLAFAWVGYSYSPSEWSELLRLAALVGSALMVSVICGNIKKGARDLRIINSARSGDSMNGYDHHVVQRDVYGNPEMGSRSSSGGTFSVENDGGSDI